MDRSLYRRLGDYIEPYSEKNTGLKVSLSQGINNNKYFQTPRQVAQNSENDQIVRRGKFAYNKATTRNGEKISIAYRDEQDCTVSSAYQVFYIMDEEKLNPYYLLLWFKRPEFDRYARFKSHGSAHEFFTWEEMCNVMLPVPPIEEQRRIVSEYQTVEHRIANNEALIQKLEETAQAIYHHTFVEGIDEENLPEGWNVTDVEHFCIETKSGGTPSRTNDSYWNKKDIPWLKSGEVQNCFVFDTEEYISKEGMECSSAKLIPKDSVVMAMYGATASQVCYLKNEMTTNQACCNMICDSKSKACFLYFHLKAIQSDIKKLANGGAQENLNKELVVSQRIICAPNDCYLPFLKIGNYISNISEENIHLRTLLSLLTSKLS